MTIIEDKYPLREKKHAKTKLALTESFTKRMELEEYDAISIKEVCQQVEVSEATFFNYFPKKIDVIIYFHHLFFLKLYWRLEHESQTQDPLQRIMKLLDYLADDIPEPNVFFKFIGVYLKDRQCKDAMVEISDAEKYYAYPDLAGIEAIKPANMDSYLQELIERAIAQKMIKPAVGKDEVWRAVHTILIGTPMSCKENFSELKESYQKQLTWLWQSLCV